MGEKFWQAFSTIGKTLISPAVHKPVTSYDNAKFTAFLNFFLLVKWFVPGGGSLLFLTPRAFCDGFDDHRSHIFFLAKRDQRFCIFSEFRIRHLDKIQREQ